MIKVILDKSNRTGNYISADFIERAGIPPFVDARHAIAHNKIVVVDGTTVLTGLFNFRKAAEDSNAENLLVIQDTAIVAKNSANWEIRLTSRKPIMENQI